MNNGPIRQLSNDVVTIVTRKTSAVIGWKLKLIAIVATVLVALRDLDII